MIKEASFKHLWIEEGSGEAKFTELGSYKEDMIDRS